MSIPSASLMLISILLPNPSPSFGRIGAFYFEVMDQSQVWIDLEPQNSEPGPNPVKLNFTVAFPGYEIEHAPDTVGIRAESNSVFLQRIRQPILRLRAEDGSEVDLTAPGKTFQFVGRCQDCAADMIIARMPFSDLCRIAGSSSLTIEALGFAAHMRPEDIQSLRQYVQTVQGGIRLKAVYYLWESK
jgi:hypothetical protein